MARAACLSVLIWISGCAALASKEAAIGCQMADITSTEYALRNPNAYETSPIQPQGLLYAIKFALSLFIYYWDGWDDSPQAARILVAATGCYPVYNNIKNGSQKRTWDQ